MNINQGIISPQKPNILKNERIYVYVPKATNNSAGIASFSGDYFYVDTDSQVHIRLTDPFETQSLVHLNNVDFWKNLSNNEEIRVRWVYAHNPVTPNNTNGYGLMKIGEDSVGYLRYNNGLLEVDYDKLEEQLEEDIEVGDVSELEERVTALEDDKVDKVEGKGLSTNDYTDADKTKLSEIDLSNYYTKSETYSRVEIDSKISSVYKPAGSVAFANLPTLSADVLGNVYNITDSFTTTSDFVEGAGKSYPAGTNVVVVDVGTVGSPSYKFDVFAGIIDLSGYVPTTRTINNKALSSDITLTAADVGAQATLSTAQQSAVDSGITSTLVAQIGTNTTDIGNKMNKANPSGTGSISMNPNPNYDVALDTVILGYNCAASRDYGVSIGYNNRVSATNGISIGSNNMTSGVYAISLGAQTEASGQHSQSQGYKTKATKKSQFVFGEFNALDNSGSASTRGDYVEIVGNGTAENARSNARTLDWNGNEVLAGTLRTAGLIDGNNATYKLVIPNTTSWTADKTIATSDEIANKMDKDNPVGTGSIEMNKTSGSVGLNSATFGHHCLASGPYATAHGANTVASGTSSHATGDSTVASGIMTYAGGYKTIASRRSHHVFGEYNVAETGEMFSKGIYIEIVGNGTSENNRSNARTLDWSGNEYLAGNLQCAGFTDGTTTKTMTEILAGGGGGTQKYLKRYIVSLLLTYGGSSFTFRGVKFCYVSDNDTKQTTIYSILTEMGATSQPNYVMFSGGTAIVDGKTYYLNDIPVYYSNYMIIVPYNAHITNITDNTLIITTALSSITMADFNCVIEEL